MRASAGRGALVGAVAAVPLVVICIVLAGVGHGWYVPALLCFPYAMLLAIAWGSIAWPSVLLALLQMPVYGALAGAALARPGRVRAWRGVLLAHVAVAALALILAAHDGTFWP